MILLTTWVLIRTCLLPQFCRFFLSLPLSHFYIYFVRLRLKDKFIFFHLPKIIRSLVNFFASIANYHLIFFKIKVPGIYFLLWDVLLPQIIAILQWILLLWRRKREINGKILSLCHSVYLFGPKNIFFYKLRFLGRRNWSYPFFTIFLSLFKCFLVYFVFLHDENCCCWVKLMIKLLTLFFVLVFCFLSETRRKELFIHT